MPTRSGRLHRSSSCQAARTQRPDQFPWQFTRTAERGPDTDATNASVDILDQVWVAAGSLPSLVGVYVCRHSSLSCPRIISSRKLPLAQHERRSRPSVLNPARLAAWIIEVLSAAVSTCSRCSPSVMKP